jgi:CRP-like cAMP-binding protein
MGVASFFDYPGEDAGPPPEDALFLADLDDAGWDRLLGYTEVRRYRPGDLVLAAGTADRSLYIVADGEVELVGQPPVVLATGTVFGEGAFLDGHAHEVAVRASTDVDLLVLTPASFEVLAARDPALARSVLTDLGRLLARRLRALRRGS